MPKSIELPITLAYAKGGYSVAAELGSRRQRANLLLDTGSSTLAVLPHAYDPARDEAVAATPVAQQVTYGAGTWSGPVLRTRLAFGSGEHARGIDDADVARIESNAQAYYDADGIFGLAYAGLDTAHDCTQLLDEREINPTHTWPWPFATSTAEELSAFKSLLRQQPAVTLKPCFSALEEEGVLRNLFALRIGRALVHVLDDAATPEQLAADPLNDGLLILGGGEHCQDHYDGPMHSIRIVHDLYYNANLIAVSVGGGTRIAAPPLKDADLKRAASNAIFDTGCSFLILQQSIYDAVIAAFAEHDPRLPELIEQFTTAFAKQQGIPNTAVDFDQWPDLHFILEGVNGAEVQLNCTPACYWQRNAMQAGQAYFLLARQLPRWADQSILGLPLMAHRYLVFDRRVQGNGVLRVARAASR